jgi:hypothetical protein
MIPLRGPSTALALFVLAVTSLTGVAAEPTDPASAAQDAATAADTRPSVGEEPLIAAPPPQPGAPPQVGPSPRIGTSPRIAAPLEAGDLAKPEGRGSTLALIKSGRPAQRSKALDQAQTALDRGTLKAPGRTDRQGGASSHAEIGVAELTLPPRAPRPALGASKVQLIGSALPPRVAGPLQLGAPPRLGPPPKLPASPEIAPPPKPEAGPT